MDDDGKRREREFDAVTFLLAGVLSAIVIGALGYGVFKSSRIGTTVPPLAADTPAPVPLPATTGSR